MIVKKDIKKYIGAFDSEEKAARFYDKYALIIQGFEVSTLKSTVKSYMTSFIVCTRPRLISPTRRAR